MKSFLIVLVFACGLIMSCNESGIDTNVVDEGKELSTPLEEAIDMDEISLDSYDLNISLSIPVVETLDGEIVTPEILHQDGDYLWYINIGKYFHLIIEDYAREFDKVTQEKLRLQSQEQMFDIKYLINQHNLIFYSRRLKGENGGNTSYHCFAEIKVEGYNYVLRSEKIGGYQQVIQDMILTIKSAKEITISKPV